MSQGAGHLGTLWRQEGIRGICSSDRATGASSTVNTAAAVRKEEVTPLLLSGLILLLFAPVDAEEGEAAEEKKAGANSDADDGASCQRGRTSACWARSDVFLGLSAIDGLCSEDSTA